MVIECFSTYFFGCCNCERQLANIRTKSVVKARESNPKIIELIRVGFSQPHPNWGSATVGDSTTETWIGGLFKVIFLFDKFCGAAVHPIQVEALWHVNGKLQVYQKCYIELLSSFYIGKYY